MSNYLPEPWDAIVAECERREAGWAKAMANAGHGQERWRLSEQRAADIAKWHAIAVRIARTSGIPGLVMEDLIGVGRPPQPQSAQQWLDLLAMVRRTVDREAANGDTDAYRNLNAIWRWFHIYVHVWRLPAIEAAAPQQRNAA